VTNDVSVEIRRLPSSDGLPLPTYMTAGAAGMDLHAAIDANVTLDPGDVQLIPTGLAIALPAGHEAQVRPRSGLAVTHRVGMPNAPATIDADYRGEIKVPLINWGSEAFTITRGMRVAQLVVAPVARVAWQEVAELPPTIRAERGFGHSGL
jgi:dUTP diphosphatase